MSSLRESGNGKRKKISPAIVAVGHMMKEMIQFPDHVLGPTLGGVAAYFSVVVSKLGLPTGVVSKIGRDFSEELLHPLRRAGVDFRGVAVVSAGRRSTLIYDEQGNKKMVYPCAGVPIHFADIPEEYLPARIFYIVPEEGEVLSEVVEKLSALRKTLAVDLGGYGGAHCSKPAREDQTHALAVLLPHFAIAKASLEDCRYLFPGITNPELLAKKLVSLGVETAIITRSESGVLIANARESFEIPSLAKDVIDCTGAGDAFAAGFLFAYQQGLDVEKAGLFGSATSAVIISRTGGITFERIPSYEEVSERIKDYDKTFPVTHVC
jgi:sugar/nucleoside kinase (ribokinase family)